MQPLLLASSSIYRRELMERLRLPFKWASPNIDESPLPDETPEKLVLRLAEAKARVLVAEHPDHLIIGSDQVASFAGTIVGKPLTMERAVTQLRQFSGCSVDFFTSLCLINAANGHTYTIVEPYRVHFRLLTDRQIENYLLKELPLDCAGSFKAEGLGICLFESMCGRDPNTLLGLPLMALTELLIKEGMDPLSFR